MAKKSPAKITKTVESLKHDAANPSRWTIQFGRLNADRLWVFDEIQLMGAEAGDGFNAEEFELEEVNFGLRSIR